MPNIHSIASPRCCDNTAITLRCTTWGYCAVVSMMVEDSRACDAMRCADARTTIEMEGPHDLNQFSCFPEIRVQNMDSSCRVLWGRFLFWGMGLDESGQTRDPPETLEPPLGPRPSCRSSPPPPCSDFRVDLIGLSRHAYDVHHPSMHHFESPPTSCCASFPLLYRPT